MLTRATAVVHVRTLSWTGAGQNTRIITPLHAVLLPQCSSLSPLRLVQMLRGYRPMLLCSSLACGRSKIFVVKVAPPPVAVDCWVPTLGRPRISSTPPLEVLFPTLTPPLIFVVSAGSSGCISRYKEGHKSSLLWALSSGAGSTITLEGW